MKKFIVPVFILIAGLFITTNGYGQMNPEERQAQMKQKLKTELKMTDVQADSVTAINMSYRPQMMEIFQDQSLSQDDKKAKMKTIVDQADTRLQPVLGDSLLAQYKDWRKKNMQQMRGGRPGNN
jgi:hypothetical protein